VNIKVTKNTRVFLLRRQNKEFADKEQSVWVTDFWQKRVVAVEYKDVL